LAYFIQALAALLLASSVAQAAPFSHRVHLQLKLSCVTCHASVQTSTRVEDNNLPKREICLGCHTGAKALPGGPSIKAPERTLLSKFSHQQHLKLGNIAPLIAKAIDTKNYLQPVDDIRRHLNTKNACAACHRGLEQSDAVTHAALPQMADCLVCHNKIDPPFSCETCHSTSAQLKPASHDKNWLDLHATGKSNMDKTTCAVCHGRKFTCRGCH
jgi:hypothetical protein